MKKINDSIIKKAAKSLDDAFKFKGILEVVDGLVFKVALRALNEEFAERIPDKFEEPIHVLVTALATGDYTKVTDEVIETLNELVDIPQLNEEEEGVFISGIVKTIVALIKRKRK